MIIYCIVTNDLSYDQRMIRIATSLANAGYTVELVGRKRVDSIPLINQPFRQKRIRCVFTKGKFFYAEYNIRLFFFLLFKKMDCICAIDLDTILPCFYISGIKKVSRVYDAHELFCEMKEIVARPPIYRFWKKIERHAVPAFDHGYTVSNHLATEFKTLYNKNYEVIMNVPAKKDFQLPAKKSKYILYQGAVNEGRCFEKLIPAMKFVNAQLIVCGDGNFMEQAKKMTAENELTEKIIFKGYVPPALLKEITINAWVGVNLLEDTGLNNHYSLANRFFDYIHALVPQLCIDLPAYSEINDQVEVAVLIKDIPVDNISRHLNILLEDENLYNRLQQNCIKAKEVFNWDNEEKKLLKFYKNLLG